MTIGFAVKIFFEVAVVLLIAYGILHEDRLIAFEEEFFPLLRFCFSRYILRKKPVQKRTASSERPRYVPRRYRKPFRVISCGRDPENGGRSVA